MTPFAQMEPMAEEQLDYEDEEYGGGPKTQYQGGGAISALADEELMGEDNEYDDLYNDVNVGDGFLQLQRSEAPVSISGLGNRGIQVQENNGPDSRAFESGVSQEVSIPGVGTEGKDSTARTSIPERQKGGFITVKLEEGTGDYPGSVNVAEKGRILAMAPDAHVGHTGFRESALLPPKVEVDPNEMSRKYVSGSNSGIGGPRGAPQTQVNQAPTNVNANHPAMNENPSRPAVENGTTMLFVGELHWWTTDAELESVLSQYGRVKEIKFFDERASGKSKGYCQVEFYEATSAAACKEGMNGYVFTRRHVTVVESTEWQPRNVLRAAFPFILKFPRRGEAPPYQFNGRNKSIRNAAQQSRHQATKQYLRERMSTIEIGGMLENSKELDRLRKLQESVLLEINQMHKKLQSANAVVEKPGELSRLKSLYVHAKELSENEAEISSTLISQLDALLQSGPSAAVSQRRRIEGADQKKKRMKADSDISRISSAASVKSQLELAASLKGEQVAARVRLDDAEKDEWFIVKVIHFDKETREFEVLDEEPGDDEGVGEQRKYKLPISHIIPFPKQSDPSNAPNFPTGKHVLAVYPGTTALYKATVVNPYRKRKTDDYLLEFDDDEDEEDGSLPQRTVPFHNVVPLPEGHRQ